MQNLVLDIFRNAEQSHSLFSPI